MKKNIESLIRDEIKAERDYKDSAKSNKSPLKKKTYLHIAPEEKEHSKELKNTKRKIASKMKK